ncbi:S8 family peptidase [Microbacterium sp. ZW T5_56]|uniref:S8 family peptidase n=1 Tax=Microbacterium sp. ZW T5_56 TaxID=3378081 RepID=UPI00385210A3
MTRVPDRWAVIARRFVPVVVVLGLSLGTVMPASAATDDPNWWYSGMHVDEARAEGLTGAGVKIGIVDTRINPQLDLFSGASLTVSPGSSCIDGGEPTSQTPDEGTVHGTAMAALLLARPVGDVPMQGIAPDADVTFYSTSLEGEDCVDGPEGRSSIMEAVLRAIRDGNRIVSVSMGQDSPPEPDTAVIAEALARGVVIVASTPNNISQRGYVSPQGYNGVVAAAAVGRDGELQRQDDDVTPMIVPGVTVVAPGIKILQPANSTGWEGMSLSTGSSTATPLVAGSLALLLQKYPSATGNQLIQALISSTANAVDGIPFNPTNGYGYGAVSLRNLLATDPTALPDVNPLMNKTMGLPTAEQVAAGGGTPKPTESAPATTAPSSPDVVSEPTSDAPPAASGESPAAVVPWLIGGGVGVMVIVIVVVIVVATRTRPKV